MFSAGSNKKRKSLKPLAAKCERSEENEKGGKREEKSQKRRRGQRQEQRNKERRQKQNAKKEKSRKKRQTRNIKKGKRTQRRDYLIECLDLFFGGLGSRALGASILYPKRAREPNPKNV